MASLTRKSPDSWDYILMAIALLMVLMLSYSEFLNYKG